MPELLAPVPPQSTIRPSSIANSCELSLSSWYCAVVSRLPKPAMVGPPGPRICDQTSPIEMPKSSVMRFETSAETSHSVAGGTSPVRDHDTVGSDSSSATHGSSMASVAGKKRAPTKQWANASVKGSAANTSASATAREYLWIPDMEALHWRQRNTAADAGRAAGLHAAGGGARERWSLVSRPPTRTMFCGAEMDWLAASGARAIFAGGGTAAVSIRQPMQQLSMQCLLLVSPEVGASPP